MESLNKCNECEKQMKEGFFVNFVDTPSKQDPNVCNECRDKDTKIKTKEDEEIQYQADLKREQDISSLPVLTIENIPQSMEPIGLVCGSTARTKKIFSDIGAEIKTLVGGEVVAYTKLMSDAREQALYRLKEDAFSKKADMVIGVRFTSTTIDTGISELVAYGTAVKKIS